MFYVKRSPIWPDPRVQPPPGAAQINYDHPLGTGMLALMLGNRTAGQPVILGPGRLWTTPTGTDQRWAVNGHGRAREYFGDTSYDRIVAFPIPSDNFTALTIRRKTDTTLRAGSIFGAASGTELQCHCPFNDGTVYWDFGANFAPWRLTWSGYAVSTVPEFWAHVGGTKGSAIYFGGVRRATQGSAISAPVGTVPFAINQWPGGSTGDRQEVSFFAIVNAQWGPERVAQWTAEPYAMLLPVVRRRYFGAGGGGGGGAAGGALVGVHRLAHSIPTIGARLARGA